MKKGKLIGKIVGIALVLVLVVGVLGGIGNIAGGSSEGPSISITNSLPRSTTGDITTTLEAGQYEISQVGDYSIIEMDGFGSIVNPGEPKLPYKTFLIALPPGAEAVSVDLVNQSYEEIPGEYRIMPALPIISGQEGEEVRWGENEEIYSSENAYPSSSYEYLGMGQMRKYNFAKVRFCPIVYCPASNKLGLYRSITLKIKYEISQLVPPELLSDTVMEDVASQIIINYPSIKLKYQSAMGPSPVSYNYVIITTDSLQSAVQPLVTWKTAIGYSVRVVTTSWISSNYAGIDLPERIRNLLIDKYAEWGIRYVLIVGSHSTIPMRYCYPDPSNHISSSDPEIDGRTPTDYYYADLTGNWDSDGDGYFGEYGQDNVDFYPEVYVGRIPVDNSAMVTSICQKSASFEQDSASWKKKALLLGAIIVYENEDGEGYRKTDGAALTEVCWNDILSGKGYARERMHEAEGLAPSTYAFDHSLTNSDALNASYGWPSGYGIVNWRAHGWTDGASRKVWAWDDGDDIPESNEMEEYDFISSSDANSLNDSKPAVVFSGSCLNAYPEETTNLGKSLLQQGAVAFVGATRNSWSAVPWQNVGDGGLDSIDYYFLHYLINQDQKCGDALYNSKSYYLDHFTGGIWESWGWSHWQNMFDFCLYGEPSLGMATIASNNPPNMPSGPSPADHATGVSIDADLSWIGGDPDAGDTVTYDVYFGTSSTPPLVSDDQWRTTYDPGTLAYNTKYYWQIVATDNHVASTPGPLWDFTTSTAGQLAITVFPTSFDVTLPSNRIQNYTLTIGNTGSAILTYSISDKQTAGEVTAAEERQGSFSTKPASVVLEVPLESSVVEPENIGEAQSGWQNIMTEGFEGAFPNGLWVAYDVDGATNGEYYWDEDDYEPHWGSWSAWCANGGADGLDPEFYYYPPNMKSWMVYGRFDLSDATGAELNFYYWLDTESDYDYVSWMASVDGDDFYGWSRSGNSGGWVSKTFDLTDVPTLGNLCGQAQVWIAFIFESNESNTGNGAFIDDIVLRKYAGAVNNPPNSPSSPSPSNQATGVSIDADLSWIGEDPDAGDTVTYDVYFGTSAGPPLVWDDQLGTAYDPGTLADNTTYYWQIVATDNHAASTTGPVWNFTTIIAGDCPWLDENPKSGTVEPGNSDSMTVTIDTTGLANGDYSAEIVISSNDPREQGVTVPVALHVGPWELTITSTAGGTVTTPGVGTFAYDEGTVVNLVATPSTGCRFVNWTGNVGTIADVEDATTTVTMNGDYSVTANFEEIPRVQRDLSVNSTEGGSVTSPGEGTFAYDEGTSVDLEAEPEEGYRFVNWIGDVGTVADVNAASTTITVNDDYSITATFRPLGGCFIATAAYGTPMAEEIQILREFRDEYLLTNPVGQALVNFYYKVSPPIAEFITEHPALKPIVRAGLLPAVAMSAIIVNATPAEKMVVVGLLVLVSVALAVWATRRRSRGPQYACG